MASVTRRQTTIELSEEVLQQAAALAQELGQPLDDFVELALVEHVGHQAIRETRAAGSLDAETALGVAYAELQALRAERRS